MSRKHREVKYELSMQTNSSVTLILNLLGEMISCTDWGILYRVFIRYSEGTEGVQMRVVDD